MNAETRKNAAVTKLFEGAYVQGQEIYVRVNAANVEQFHSNVAELSDLRRTRRFDPEKTGEREMFKFVRQNLALKGKHVHIHLVTPTKNEDVVQTTSGETVQIDKSFKFLTPQKVRAAARKAEVAHVVAKKSAAKKVAGKRSASA